jgi:outer membrane protein
LPGLSKLCEAIPILPRSSPVPCNLLRGNWVAASVSAADTAPSPRRASNIAMHLPGPRRLLQDFWSSVTLRKNSGRCLLTAMLAALGLSFVPAAAQQSAPAPEPASAPVQAALNSGSGLTLLDVLQAALQKNPQLRIEQYTVDARAGALQTAAGQFDWNINASGDQQRGYTPLTPAYIQQNNLPSSYLPFVDSTVANTSTASASAVKELRDGITLTPSLRMTRLTDNIFNTTGTNQADVGLQINLPLLRNRGKSNVDALEESAGKELDATRLDLNQLVSDTLASAAISYWTFVAADATLALYKASEDRGKEVLDSTEKLVSADRLPANDLNQARANLSSRIESREAAEQSMLQARQQLILVMGLDAERILELPEPAQDIPGIIPPVDTSLLPGYIQMAKTRRADVLAARLRVESNLILQRAASNQLKPQFDVSGAAGYTGLRDGTGLASYPQSVFTTPRGVNFNIGLVYNQSPANNAAAGRLKSAVATSSQSEIVHSEAARVAASSVVVAFQGVRSSILQLQRAREAVKFYQDALAGEREKYRLRLNSLVDVLTVEDRLTSAVINEVSARLGYATALVQVRQATGTIVDAGEAAPRIDPQIFYQLPAVTAVPDSTGKP